MYILCLKEPEPERQRKSGACANTDRVTAQAAVVAIIVCQS